MYKGYSVVVVVFFLSIAVASATTTAHLRKFRTVREKSSAGFGECRFSYEGLEHTITTTNPTYHVHVISSKDRDFFCFDPCREARG